MMKKRILILGLLLSLLLALTACGETPEASAVPSATTEDAASQSPAALETTSVETATPSTAPVESTAAETAIPSTAPVESTADDGTDRNLDARGSWEGDVYTNQRFGFRISVPEGFLRFNDYQIAQYNYMSSDQYLKTDTARLVQNSGNLLVMDIENYKGSAAYLTLRPAEPL